MILWHNKLSQDYIIGSDDNTQVLNLCKSINHESIDVLIYAIKWASSDDLLFSGSGLLRLTTSFKNECDKIADLNELSELHNLKETHPEYFI